MHTDIKIDVAKVVDCLAEINLFQVLCLHPTR
jgi:hypothetical protein